MSRCNRGVIQSQGIGFGVIDRRAVAAADGCVLVVELLAVHPDAVFPQAVDYLTVCDFDIISGAAVQKIIDCNVSIWTVDSQGSFLGGDRDHGGTGNTQAVGAINFSFAGDVCGIAADLHTFCRQPGAVITVGSDLHRAVFDGDLAAIAISIAENAISAFRACHSNSDISILNGNSAVAVDAAIILI